MPFVLAVECEIEIGEPRRCLGSVRLGQLREIRRAGSGVHAALEKSIESLRAQCSNRSGYGQHTPVDSRELRPESELMTATGFHHIFGQLILCVVPATSREENVV